MSAPLLEVRGLRVAPLAGSNHDTKDPKMGKAEASTQKDILRGVDLRIEEGEMHVLMGPNGSGKSTLANVLAGREDYEILGGQALLNGQDILSLTPEERVGAGLFLGFQYPSEVAGLSNTSFLREIVNARRARMGAEALDPLAFLRILRAEMQKIPMPDRLAKRALNVGFSGGEKKLNEVLQLALLEPRLAILDETDSGLDLDALRNVATAIDRQRTDARGFLLITHYQRLLNALPKPPDRVHIFAEGRIVLSGDAGLAARLEQLGYDALIAEAA